MRAIQVFLKSISVQFRPSFFVVDVNFDNKSVRDELTNVKSECIEQNMFPSYVACECDGGQYGYFPSHLALLRRRPISAACFKQIVSCNATNTIPFELHLNFQPDCLVSI